MWQKSKCPSGLWLHDFQITRYFGDGVEEICSRCGQVEFFRHRDPNDYYLSYHLRSALQRWMREFNVEYEK
jgi:hypothetical protein